MKVCRRCGEEKDNSNFNKHPKPKDGLSPYCKDCVREYDRARRNTPEGREKLRAAQRRYNNSKKGKQKHLEWRSKPKNRKSVNDRVAKYRKQNKLEVSARLQLARAVNDGEVVRGEVCEDCGRKSDTIEGHHNDYTKPLEVEWLCSRCHGKRHRIKDQTTLPASYERN